jgi:hypothetical protein
VQKIKEVAVSVNERKREVDSKAKLEDLQETMEAAPVWFLCSF